MRRRITDMRTMKDLFGLAEAEARRAGETEPGAEHLLLAALGLPEGSARRALERVGVDAAGLRDAIVGQRDAARRGVGDAAANASPLAAVPHGPYRSKESAQTMFQRVTTLVRSERSQLYGAWFVLVASEGEHGTTARSLRHLGVEADALARAARAELDALHG